MSRSFLLAMTVLATSLGCSHRVNVGPRAREVLYVFPDSPTLFVIDPNAGRVIAAPGPVPHGRLAPVFSSDSSVLYFAAADSSESGIYELDTRSFAIQRLLDLRRSPVGNKDSLKVFGALLATVPNVDVLFDGSAMVHDRPGQYPAYTQRIAAIDVSSGQLSIASPPLSIVSLTPLPAGPVAPHGALIVLPLAYPQERTILGWLLLFDPLSRMVLDSLGVPKYMPGNDPPDSVPYPTEYARSVVPSPDGRRVYVLGWNGIYGFDLATRKLFAVVRAPSYGGHLAVSPDGRAVYFLEDDFLPIPMIASRAPVAATPPIAAPPSRIRVFDADLIERHSIPFGSQFTPRSPSTRPVAIAVSGDNKALYLTANTPGAVHGGTLHVIVLSLETRRIVRDIPLPLRGGATLFVGHLSRSDTELPSRE